jgi:hypothetical protein
MRPPIETPHGKAHQAPQEGGSFKPSQPKLQNPVYADQFLPHLLWLCGQPTAASKACFAHSTGKRSMRTTTVPSRGNLDETAAQGSSMATMMAVGQEMTTALICVSG